MTTTWCPRCGRLRHSLADLAIELQSAKSIAEAAHGVRLDDGTLSAHFKAGFYEATMKNVARHLNCHARRCARKDKTP